MIIITIIHEPDGEGEDRSSDAILIFPSLGQSIVLESTAPTTTRARRSLINWLSSTAKRTGSQPPLSISSDLTRYETAAR